MHRMADSGLDVDQPTVDCWRKASAALFTQGPTSRSLCLMPTVGRDARDQLPLLTAGRCVGLDLAKHAPHRPNLGRAEPRHARSGLLRLLKRVPHSVEV